MKHLVLTLSLCLCSFLVLKAQTPEDSTAFFNAEWQRTKLGKGAEAVTVKAEMFGSPQHITFIKYPMRRFKTEMVYKPGKGAAKTSVLAAAADGKFALNGGYFDGKYAYTTFLKIHDSLCCESIYTNKNRINGALCISRNGKKITIKAYNEAEHDACTDGFSSVITCGPLLMVDGKIAELLDMSKGFSSKRHPRSVIGYDRKGYAYLIVIDGRHKGNAAGATIPEASFIARILGLEAALNLDGGGSSTLWSEQLGVHNYPCDNKTFNHEGERKVPHIVIAR